MIPRKRFPVSKESCIDYVDYSRMSTQQHKPSGDRRLETPKWAINDSMLRELLTAFMEERAGFRRAQRGTLAERLDRASKSIMGQRHRMIATLDKLCAEYVLLKQYGARKDISDDELNSGLPQPLIFAEMARPFIERRRLRQLEIEVEGLDTFLRCSENGGADIIVSVIYLYYRLCYDSVGVGAELHLKPTHCRQILYRLFQTAEKLWPKQELVIVNGVACKDSAENHTDLGMFDW